MVEVTELLGRRNQKGCHCPQAEPQPGTSAGALTAVSVQGYMGFHNGPINPVLMEGWGTVRHEWGLDLKCLWLAFGPEQWSLLESSCHLGRGTHMHLVCVCTLLSHWLGIMLGKFSSGIERLKIIYRSRDIPSQV